MEGGTENQVDRQMDNWNDKGIDSQMDIRKYKRARERQTDKQKCIY
jgi:hypothetical protein